MNKIREFLSQKSKDDNIVCNYGKIEHFIEPQDPSTNFALKTSLSSAGKIGIGNSWKSKNPLTSP